MLKLNYDFIVSDETITIVVKSISIFLFSYIKISYSKHKAVFSLYENQKKMKFMFSESTIGLHLRLIDKNLIESLQGH